MTEPGTTLTRRRLFGLEVDALTMEEVVGRCVASVRAERPVTVGVVNAAKVVKLRSDELLRDSVISSDVLLADGQSVVWASRLLGEPLPERVAGIDLFERLLEVADQEHLRVFLLGAKPEVLTLLEERIHERFPGLVIAGTRDGYFTEQDSDRVAAEIADSRSDMLFLGMTSPKKEIFMARYGDRLNVSVRHGVGGSFDIFAGVTKRAPLRWQRLGMEWAYRLVQEPRRMWRRYLTTNSAFLALVVRERIRQTPLYRLQGETRG